MTDYELLQDSDPTITLVTLAEAKLQAKIDNDFDDSLVINLLTTARQSCENYCNRAFINQRWRAYFDAEDLDYKGSFYLPFGKIQSVDAVGTYDTQNLITIVDAEKYYFNGNRFLFSQNGNLFQFGADYRQYQCLSIDWTAGMGTTAESVPRPIKQAMLLLIGHYYVNREAIYTPLGGKSELEALPFGVKSLLDQYRIYE